MSEVRIARQTIVCATSGCGYDNSHGDWHVCNEGGYYCHYCQEQIDIARRQRLAEKEAEVYLLHEEHKKCSQRRKKRIWYWLWRIAAFFAAACSIIAAS